MRSVYIDVLDELSVGKPVSRKSGMAKLESEMRRRGLQAFTHQHARTLVTGLFQDIVQSALGVYTQEFLPSDLEVLNQDNRVKHMYIAPAKLSLKTYAALEQDLSYWQGMEEKARSIPQQANVDSSTAGRASEPSEQDLSVVIRASKIVFRDLCASDLNAKRSVPLREQLDTGTPDPREYIMTRFPKTYLAMLAGCTGKDYIMELSEESELRGVILVLGVHECRRTA